MLKPHDKAHTQRLMLAVVFSLVILLGFEFMTAGMRPAKPVAPEVAAPVAEAPAAAAVAGAAVAAAPSATLVTLLTPRMEVGYNPVGGRVERVVLRELTVKGADSLGYAQLHTDGPHAEYAESGWLGSGIETPAAASLWQVVASQPDRAELVWRNGSGQEFHRVVQLDAARYELAVTDTVRNTASLPVTVTPYAQVHRVGGSLPNELSSFVNHLGPMGVLGGDEPLLKETDFDDLADGQQLEVAGRGGWWGFASQYFLTALLPPEGRDSVRSFKASKVDGAEVFSAGVRGEALVVPPAGEASYTTRLYAGPKQEDALMASGQHLERAIDWGWFRMLARPFYRGLLWLHNVTGSWALALLALTFLLKLATFPLANKSYHAMAKMKKLQPQMEAMRERFKDDQQGMALEMMKLYQREKVNPLSGCWPMLIQIPIFFAMYKVVLLAFEFRHAAPGLWPLDYWVRDLSVGDPLYILPVLMGLSMWMQMRLNPPPADPAQAAVFKWMPVIFTVMFLWFPAALVWYWLVNNVFSIAQQAYIMRKDKAL